MGRRKITFLQRIGYIFEFLIVVPLALLLMLFPFFLDRPLAWLFGSIAYLLDGANKKRARENFKILFKENPLSKKEQNRILYRLHKNIIRFGLEYIKIGRVTAKNYKRFAVMENTAALEKAEKKGKGVICVTLHLGNWEWLGTIPAKLGTDLAVVMERQWNPYTDKFLRWLREKPGQMKCFYNEISAVRGIAKHLRSGGTIALVADQTYYFKPLIIPFFGKNCGTADGPAKMHFKYGAPIVMCYSYRGEDGKYVMRFEDPVEFKREGSPEEDYERVMKWVNQKYESYIMDHLDQWFSLLHPRWERTTAEEFEDLDYDPF